MLTPSYDHALVLASIAVSIMASYTGLTLTRGISVLPDSQRKFMIVMASLALGGGIWSMHFVAMLAMRMPLPINYDALYTLGSALIAILMAGVAFLILHYSGRSWAHIAVAGVILGNGIVAMHYVGMSGMRGCLPIFSPAGVALAIAGATVMGIAALGISYRQRSTVRIFAGAVSFGLSVVLVHFVAMGWTSFEEAASALAATPLLDNGTLAILVMLSAFVICGTFLLTSANFIFAKQPATVAATAVGVVHVAEAPARAQVQTEAQAAEEDDEAPLPERLPIAATIVERLPYERDKRTHFIEADQVAAIRAEGHYSILYTRDDKLFCPLSISTVEKRLRRGGFVRTHRSYLVNKNRVAAFERQKDNGICLFEGVQSLKAAPVCRGYIPQVRSALGI
jgi:NO-binding membrane sensor protein with MHYT domain